MIVHAAAWSLVAWLLAGCGGEQLASAQVFIVPTPNIRVLSPSGIRFENAEQNGVTLMAYHYSVNKPVPGIQAGDWNFDAQRQDGYYVHENPMVPVNNGDTVHYWVYAVYNGLGYHLLYQQWTYNVSTSPTPPRLSSATAAPVIAATSLNPACVATADCDVRTTTIATVSAPAPTADVTKGISTTGAIILGVVLGVAVVAAAILSAILVLRSRRNSTPLPPVVASSHPPSGNAPETVPARPPSLNQSHLYAYVDYAYIGRPAPRLPAEDGWPDTAAPLGAKTEVRNRPQLPLPQGISRASATPATDNYYIRLVTEYPTQGLAANGSLASEPRQADTSLLASLPLQPDLRQIPAELERRREPDESGYPDD